VSLGEWQGMLSHVVTGALPRKNLPGLPRVAGSPLFVLRLRGLMMVGVLLCCHTVEVGGWWTGVLALGVCAKHCGTSWQVRRGVRGVHTRCGRRVCGEGLGFTFADVLLPGTEGCGRGRAAHTTTCAASRTAQVKQGGLAATCRPAMQQSKVFLRQPCLQAGVSADSA
jgi:hypothetical protein